jgi:hypothetical protein
MGEDPTVSRAGMTRDSVLPCVAGSVEMAVATTIPGAAEPCWDGHVGVEGERDAAVVGNRISVYGPVAPFGERSRAWPDPGKRCARPKRKCRRDCRCGKEARGRLMD